MKFKIHQVKKFYDNRAKDYEKNLHLTFKTHNVNETKERLKYIKKLKIKKNFKILDLACGTGRDSILIAKKLDPQKGYLVMQDISKEMIKICKKKMSKIKIKKKYVLAKAEKIPFKNNYFDAVYSFGGIGEFENIEKAMKEISRVTKIGGKVVIGDEGIAPWLKETKYFNILKKTNPLIESKLPLSFLPIEARKAKLEWILGQSFFLISFEIGKGEPKANFDIQIPGIKGGTYRTRLEGEIEGVTIKAKKKLLNICKRERTSMHDFLTNLIMNYKKK